MVTRNRLRICIVTEFFYPDNTGGTAVAMSNLARELADRHGAQIDVITSVNRYRGGKGKLSRREDWDGIQIRRIGAPDWNNAGFAKRAAGNILFTAKLALKLLFGRKYDIVLTTTAPPFVPFAAALNRAVRRTPFSYMVYDLEPDRTSSLGVLAPESLPVRMLAKAQKQWLSSASRVFAIGRCMRDRLVERYGIEDGKVAVVPVGAQLSQVAARNPHAVDREEGRMFRVLYSGNLGRYHDFDTILDCAKDLLTEPNIEFVIVGNGAKRDHIRQRIEDEQIRNVRQLSLVPAEEYGDLLASADACLITMETGIDGTCVPSKLYSIMAAGKAVLGIVAEGSEVAQTLAEANCGVRVPQEDRQALKQTILELRANPDRVREMGLNARDVFLTEYAMERVADDVYTHLAIAAGIRSRLRVPTTPVASEDVSTEKTTPSV